MIKILDPASDEDEDGFTNEEEFDNDTDYDDEDSYPDLGTPVFEGLSTIDVDQFSTYTDVKPSAKDTIGKSLEVVELTNNVNTALTGSYTITYSATERKGNVGNFTRTVNVNDKEKPVITLNGEETIKVILGKNSYNDEKATMTDNVDATAQIDGVVDGSTDVVGTYNLEYNYTDASGNAADEVIRMVKILDPAGDEDEDGFTNEEEFDNDTDYDDEDSYPDLGTPVVEGTNNVNTALTGSYTITYSATDRQGNVGNFTRTVNVNDKEKPVITLNGEETIKVILGKNSYTDEKATMTDNVDATAQIDGVVDGSTDVVGTYNLEYNYTDASGNASDEVIRMIKILDPAGDEDEDGFTNEEEFDNDTDYDDEDSYPELGTPVFE